MRERSRPFETVWLLLVEIATALILFAALTAAAVVVHHVAAWGEQSGLEPLIVVGSRALEVVLALSDIICVGYSAVYAAVRFLGGLGRMSRR